LSGNIFTNTYKDLVGKIEARIEVNGWDHEPGEDLELSYDLHVSFSRWSKDIIHDHARGVWVVWAGERLFDADGRYRQMTNVIMSTYLTTTGVAVENNQPVIASREVGNLYGTPFDFAHYFPFDEDQGSAGLHLKGSWMRTLDDTVPSGRYRLTFDIVLDTEKFGSKQWASAPFLGDNDPKFFRSTSPQSSVDRPESTC